MRLLPFYSLFALQMLFGCAQILVPAAQKINRSSVQHWLVVPERKHRLHIFDVDDGHRLLKTIPIPGLKKVRGITGHAPTSTIFLSFESTVLALNPFTEKILWQRSIKADPADRLEITPDGKKLFVPAGFDSHLPFWYVLDTKDGHEIKKISVKHGAHNTIVSRTQPVAYLASLKFSYLTLISTENYRELSRIGPFQNFIRPFTVNAAETMVFANIDGVLGFQVANLKTGKVGLTIQAPPAAKTHPPHHGCPSHGIALSPDETEVWVVDSEGDRLLVFDALSPNYTLKATIDIGFDPGWIFFDLKGTHAYPSTGEIIDTKSKKIVGKILLNEQVIRSETFLDFLTDGQVIYKMGTQFGIGHGEHQ